MTTTLHPGRWVTAEADGRLLCRLCPRACRLKPGDRGFCFVRRNVDGQMVLDTYGKSTGFCIDPIEKKPLNHFLPGTPVLSFGTAGCNLGCKFCQNWDISKSREVARLSDEAGPEAIARAAEEAGCRSVAYTYNDPVIWAEYAIDTARACRARGLKSVAVTAAYITPDARGEFFDAVDAANIDLKAFSERFYHRITGAHLDPVLDTIRYVCNETDTWVELTNLVIPQANDEPDELKRMCDWVLEAVGPDVPVHFSAFHPDFRMRDRGRTPHETLVTAYELARQAGLRYVYLGNVHDVQRQSTWCHGCGELLIERDWHELGRYRLTGNRCQRCGEAIPGVFEPGPGDWGRRRQPIRILPSEPEVPSEPETVSINPPESHLSRLSEYERSTIRRAAGEFVAAAVLGGDVQALKAELGELGAREIDGLYVTLKRGRTLRGCCGLQGRAMPLADALADAALRTATQDPRMPAIAAIELPYLELSVSILGPPRPVTRRGDERVGEIEIGRHGLRIRHGDRAGLLLPTVATDQGWDARQFLDAVCRKAGLPAASWRSDGVVLEVFDGVCFSGPAGVSDRELSGTSSGMNADEIARLASWVQQNLVALQTGATPFYYAPDVSDTTVSGVVLRVVPHPELPGDGALQLSLRGGVPLQSTLFEMTRQAAAGLAGQGTATDWLIELAVLSEPVHHGHWMDNDLRGVDPARRAVVATDGRHWSVRHDGAATVEASLAAAVESAAFRRSAVQVYSVECVTNATTFSLAVGPRGEAQVTSRPPSVAGMFYPEDDRQREALVDELFEGLSEVPREPARAVMVPHAGLRFSGRVAADIWRRVEIPDSVLIIGPKHTPDGVDWAVAPHDRWELSPDASLRGADDLAREIAESVPGMQLDAAAHRREHGIEVQLPILKRLAPRVRVAAIAMHGGTLGELAAAARGLARWLAGQPRPPLLVISSDMNHFADDEENRRRDRLALDALRTGDAARLLEVCERETISMCGKLPAALVLLTLKELNQKVRYREVAYATSADVTGDTSRVVGYAGVLL